MKGILSAISFSTMAWHGPSIRMMSTTTMEYVDFILRRTLDKVRRFPAAGLYRLLAARGEIFRKNDECDQPPTRLPVSCDKSRNDPEYDMPTSNHAPAIVHWWTQVKKDGGLAAVNQSATVSTMLFGCHRWLELHADQSSAEVSEIKRIKDELESWMSIRGKTFEG